MLRKTVSNSIYAINASHYSIYSTLTYAYTDDDARIVSAITLGEMCKFAPDRMKSIASEVVPVIFFGEHDTDKATAECWKTAWESLTSGIVYFS